MRSVYRWSLGARVFVVVAVILLLASLLKTRKRTLFSIILLLLVLEGTLIDTGRIMKNSKNLANHQRFEKQVTTPLRDSLPEGSLIAFRSNENDYLAGYIAAKTGTYSYNVGGDKNTAISRKAWPSEIKEIRRGDTPLRAALKLHEEGKLDYLIFPNFSLRWSSYHWPPNEKIVQKLAAKHAPFITDLPAEAVVAPSNFFTIVSLKNLKSWNFPQP